MNKKIIITNKDYLPLLLRNKDINENIKLMTCQQAISTLTFEINDEMISELMKSGFEYTKAKHILLILQTLDNRMIDKSPKHIQKAYEIVKKLIKQPSFNQAKIFDNADIYLFNASNDIEIIQLFKSHGYSIKHLNINDLKLKESFSHTNKVINFDNKLEQYMYVFADIRTKILKDPNKANNIRILVEDRFDEYYATLFSKLFNVDVYINVVESLYCQPNVVQALKTFYNKEQISIDLITSNDPASLKLIEIINKYKLNTLDFKQGYLNLLEICVQTQYIDDSKEEKGIAITNDFGFSDKETYVLCFQDSIFYSSFKDNDVITDIEKSKLNINPSYVKTLIDKEKKISYIKFNNIVHLSRVKQHLDDHIYDSPLIKELNLEQKSFNYSDDKHVKEICSKSFTKKASEMLATILADKGVNISDIKVKKYSNGVDEISIPTPKRYSVSSIQKYNECPFKYLLDTYVDLSTLDDRYFRDLGTLIHSVLQNILSPKFDYDKLFDEAANNFKKVITEKSHGIYQKKYDAYLMITKKWFRYIAIQYRSILMSLRDKVDLKAEVKFNFTIDGVDKPFTGSIDALLISKNEGNKYYSIIDYKTGSTIFAPLAVCVGQNIQLPMYAYSLPHSDCADLVKDATLGGFGLKYVLGNSPKKYSNTKHNLTFDTLSNFTEAYLFANKTDELVKSLCNWEYSDKGKIKTTGFNQIVAFAKNTETVKGVDILIDIDKLCLQAKQVTIDSIKAIESCKFPIRCSANSNNVASKHYEIRKQDTNCSLCKYMDICYRGKENFIDQSDYVMSQWSEGVKHGK